jgi:hypothetical protein
MQFKSMVMLATAAMLVAASVHAQLTFYEAEGFRGNAFPVNQTIQNLSPVGFNDRASSVVVERGHWQVCDDAGFRGRCIVLQPGQYPSLAPFDLNNRISSVRPVGGGGNYGAVVAPPQAPTQATSIAGGRTKSCSRFPWPTYAR